MMHTLVIFVLVSILSSYGAANLKIYNGEDASPEDFPYMVSLRSMGSHFCGGTLLNSKWVLTAAHCLTNTQMCVKNIEILFGTIQSYHKKPPPSSHIVGAKRFIIHEEFLDGFERADLALIELAGDVYLNQYVQLANKEPDRTPQANSTVAGWGLTENNVISDVLKKVNVQVLHHKRCANHSEEYDRKVHICYKSKIGRTCQGDSGGPLVQGNVQYGITSYGRNCSKNTDEIMTNVYQFRSWIEKQINNP